MKNSGLYSFYTLIALSLLYILVYTFFIKKRLITYPNFGIAIPAGYYTHGIDVSHHQNDIDWEQVAAMRDRGQRISFAMIKATEANYLFDNTYKNNWKEAKKNNILRGAYLYFHPNVDGNAQANYFISKTNIVKGDLPPVIDIEVTDGQSTTQLQIQLDNCIAILKKKYDCNPIIYSNVDFYKAQLGSKYDDYPFWAAHYKQKGAPRTDRNWIIWQHNDNGRVNGIEAPVDFNVVQGGIETLQHMCID